MKYAIVTVAVCCLGGAILLTAALVAAAAPARVTMTPGGPVLSVSGKKMAPALFQVGFQGELPVGQSQVRWAAKNGVNIVSPTIWGIPWFKDEQNPTLDGTDIGRWLDAVIEANPNALLMPRFPVDQPAGWWVERHPDEMTLFHDGTRGIASIHSRVWRKDAAKQIGSLVRLLEQRYGDHMIGYHVCGQYSAEWFYDGFWESKHAGFERPAVDGFRRWLREKYVTDDALRSAWKDPAMSLDTAEVPSVGERTSASAGSFRDPASQHKAIDFDDYQNADMADAVGEMCKAVKRAAPNRLAIAFYGYTFELSGSSRSGHLGLSRLLKSPYVDGICGPYSYGDRQPGGSGRFMGPVDSVLANGKMWFTEDDTRTYITPREAAPGRCGDIRETKGVLSRNFSQVLIRGAGLWWMEPIGAGVYADEDLWRHNGLLTRIYQSSLPVARYSPEVAVVVDEASCLYAAPFIDGSAQEGLSVSLLGRFREQYYRLGAPIGMYLLDDLLAGKVPPAKMYIMLNLFRITDSQLSAIRSRACAKGRVIVWMYAPGIVNGSVLSPPNVSKVVGINLKQISYGDGNIVLTGSGAKFSAQHAHLSPTYAVSDPSASPVARYLLDGAPGDVAVAQKSTGGYTSVYCGTLQLPSSVLRSLARKAGVHIYNDQDQIVMAGNGFFAIHATSDGVKSVRLPRESVAIDALSNAKLGKSAVFAFDMRKGDTKLLRVEASR